MHVSCLQEGSLDSLKLPTNLSESIRLRLATVRERASERGRVSARPPAPAHARPSRTALAHGLGRGPGAGSVHVSAHARLPHHQHFRNVQENVAMRKFPLKCGGGWQVRATEPALDTLLQICTCMGGYFHHDAVKKVCNLGLQSTPRGLARARKT